MCARVCVCAHVRYACVCACFIIASKNVCVYECGYAYVYVCVHTCGMHACVHASLWPQNELSIPFVHFLKYVYNFI